MSLWRDRFFLGLLGFLLLLSLGVLALARWRAPALPDYREDEAAPSAVVHNYLTALLRGDQERARGYFLPPEARDREGSVPFPGWVWPFPERPRNFGFEILGEEVEGDQAWVAVRIRWSGDVPPFLPGPVEGYEYVRQVPLRRYEGRWYLTEPFFP